MEEEVKGSRVVRMMNSVLRYFVCIILLLLLLYSGTSLWDAYTQLHRSGIDEQILHLKPGAPDYDFANLLKVNSDVKGWLTIDATHIDYAILQGKDNNEYLERDIYRKFYVGGSIFLDYQCNKDFEDNYNLIHGHHMDAGAMFGDLANFEKEEYFNAHETGTLYTPQTRYELTIFACLLVDAYDSQFYQMGNRTQESLQSLLDYIEENAVTYRENADVSAEDKIIAFSTCSTAFTNSRTVVIAKMTDAGFNHEGVYKDD